LWCVTCRSGVLFEAIPRPLRITSQPLHEGLPEAAKIPRKQLIELLSQAGLPFESEKPDLLPYQVFLVFRKGT
jgi:hypothetical protein